MRHIWIVLEMEPTFDVPVAVVAVCGSRQAMLLDIRRRERARKREKRSEHEIWWEAERHLIVSLPRTGRSAAR